MEHALSQLIEKKKRIQGELKHHRERAEQLSELLYGVKIAIKAFDPNFDIKTIKAKRYTRTKNKNQSYFKRGETHRLILDTLRVAKEPLTNLEIAIELMKKKNLDYTEKDLVKSVQQSIQYTLRTQERNEIIKKTYTAKSNSTYWILA